MRMDGGRFGAEFRPILRKTDLKHPNPLRGNWMKQEKIFIHNHT